MAEGKKFLITRNNKHGVGTIKRGAVEREGESSNNYDSTHREKKRERGRGERERGRDRERERHRESERL